MTPALLPKKIYIQEEVNPHFKSVWVTDRSYTVLKGGRNSFKSSVVSLKLVYMMLKYLKLNEKVNVVIIRKVANTLRDSVYLKMQWALAKFGIVGQFKFTVSPFKITHQPTGSAFYFYGQDDFQKLKSNDIGDIIAVWYEEAAEFTSAEEFDQSNATFMRQKHPLADHVKFFWSYNPPRNPYSWINEWASSLEGQDDWLVHHSSYLDDSLGFVTPQMLDEIDRIKLNDLDYYRYMFLGEPVGLGSNVYNFGLFQEIKALPEGEYLTSLIYGLDTGHQQSATACICAGLTSKKNLIVLETYYYDPSGIERKLAPDEIAKNLYEFVSRTEDKYARPVSKMTIDSAEGAIRNQYFKDYNERWNPVAKQKKLTMIDYVVTLLAQGRLYYLEGNEEFARQHKNYRYDEKSLQTADPKIIEKDDHIPDALQYLVMDNLRELELIV